MRCGCGVPGVPYFCRRRDRQAQDCIALEAFPLSLEELADGVAESGSSLELHIKRGLWLTWFSNVRYEMRRAVPKSVMASVTNRTILNPRWVRFIIYFRQKAVDSRDRVEEWGPFPMAWRMIFRDHSGPTSTGKPFATQSSKRPIVGWQKGRGGAATVNFFADIM